MSLHTPSLTIGRDQYGWVSVGVDTDGANHNGILSLEGLPGGVVETFPTVEGQTGESTGSFCTG